MFKGIPTGVRCLDASGGIARNSVTEIVGGAGSGKTLLLHQIASRFLASEPSAKVVWFDADGSFSPEILLRISGRAGREMLRRILLILKPESVDRVLRRLREIEDCDLIIIDSLPTLFADFLSDDGEPIREYLDRIISFGKLVRRRAIDGTVLVANQVRALTPERSVLYDAFWEAEGVVPAMGKLWEYFVDERIYLKRLRPNIRAVTIVFSHLREEQICTAKYDGTKLL